MSSQELRLPRALPPADPAIRTPPPDRSQTIMSSTRHVHPEEVRAVLEALGPALERYNLPVVIPRFPTKAGRSIIDKYSSTVTVGRRGAAPPTLFEAIVIKLQAAANDGDASAE